MTILRASSAFLSALTAGVSAGTLSSPQQIGGITNGGNTGLRLINARGVAGGEQSEYAGTDAQIAALINTGAKTVAAPAVTGISYVWLRIPARWLPILAMQLGQGPLTLEMPTADALELSGECAADFQGRWATVFTALGFTAFAPTLPGQVPVVGA